MKKIVLTGINGQVGHALKPLLANNYELFALDRAALDLSNEASIRQVVSDIQPDMIINPAAYTAVDKAESESDLSHAINAEAPRILAEEAKRIGASMIHFSTDYVFDGSNPEPYLEGQPVAPLGVYGQSKLDGELAVQAAGIPHLILRTSWVYGPHGNNFLKTMLRLAAERDALRVVGDQYGSPTSSLSIAATVVQLLNAWDVNNANQSGIYHFTNAGRTSWHGFACKIISMYEDKMQLTGADIKRVDFVEAIETSEYPTPAKRPHYSALNNAKLLETFDVELPDWQEALQEVISQLD